MLWRMNSICQPVPTRSLAQGHHSTNSFHFLLHRHFPLSIEGFLSTEKYAISFPILKTFPSRSQFFLPHFSPPLHRKNSQNSCMYLQLWIFLLLNSGFYQRSSSRSALVIHAPPCDGKPSSPESEAGGEPSALPEFQGCAVPAPLSTRWAILISFTKGTVPLSSQTHLLMLIALLLSGSKLNFNEK